MVDIGTRLRDERLRLGLSLADLAQKSGLSASFISNVERNINSPTLSSLRLLLDSLGLSMLDLFRDRVAEKTVVRKNERTRIIRADSGRVQYELLSPNIDRKMEPLLVTVLPGASSGIEKHSHRGEEFGFIIKGRMRFWAGEQVYDLEEGDSIYSDATLPHRYENTGQGECISIWCITPPSF